MSTALFSAGRLKPLSLPAVWLLDGKRCLPWTIGFLRRRLLLLLLLLFFFTLLSVVGAPVLGLTLGDPVVGLVVGAPVVGTAVVGLGVGVPMVGLVVGLSVLLPFFLDRRENLRLCFFVLFFF